MSDDALDQLRAEVHEAQDADELLDAVRDYLVAMGKNVEGLGMYGHPCPVGEAVGCGSNEDGATDAGE